MEDTMNNEYEDAPLSESNVSLKLADIQRRCSELILEQADFGGLSLEEPIADTDGTNPYSRA